MCLNKCSFWISLQREKLLILIAFIAIANGYKQDPQEYEAEGISHIDYEKDQMPIKMKKHGEGSVKVKRMISPSEYESESVRHIMNEEKQTPAEDRNWQVKPKVKRMSQKSGRKVHIYLKNDEPKQNKPKKQQSTSTSTSSTTTFQSADDRTETQTKKTPELTTKSDKDVRSIKYADKDAIVAESSRSKQTAEPSDSQTDGSDHYEQHVIKEKIKIKHHHHHHHHNHVKTVVKKEPYAVEKVVHVPVEKVVEKIVEKKVPYKVEVEKIVHVNVDR